jgi:hypothetical protein
VVRVATEAAQRATGSLFSATVSILVASNEVGGSEEFQASKQSLNSAVESARKVGAGLKNSVNATKIAWAKGAGDGAKIETTDQYMLSFIEGVKSVFGSQDVRKSSSSTVSSAASTVAGLGTASGLLLTKLGSTLSQSEKWNGAIADFSKFFSLFGTSVSILAARAVKESRIDRELPPSSE